jgi:hypothetical protein
LAGLNVSFKIAEAIENELVCIVCKGELDEGRARVGFRLRDSWQNINKFGIKVVYHYMNTEVLCGPVCAEKLTKSWETEKAKKKIPELLAKIKESVNLFEKEASLIKEKESKFITKKKPNDRRSKGKN